ncbi:hypothetical protein FT643_02270 [Ketobacter sp. MCCC 1A13808]|nr:hypothetical protein [Ketobacter sp. MCCC 1A13808]RLP56519.1 MAG: hypothetical protein D6160_02865 [Ketobacter sp.]
MATRGKDFILAFLAGVFFVNVVPHFVNGVSGRPFPSPFSDPPGVGLSSPVLNVLWAAINFIIAILFVYFGNLNQRNKTVYLGYFSGVLVMAFFLADYFGKLGLG